MKRYLEERGKTYTLSRKDLFILLQVLNQVFMRLYNDIQVKESYADDCRNTPIYDAAKKEAEKSHDTFEEFHNAEALILNYLDEFHLIDYDKYKFF